MNKYKFGEKISAKGADMVIVINGVMPAGQPIIMNLEDDVKYNVAINGCNFLIKESQLDKLLESAKTYITEQEDLEPVKR